MCVTCYTPDPREVRLLELCHSKHLAWITGLFEMMEETPASQVEASMREFQRGVAL